MQNADSLVPALKKRGVGKLSNTWVPGLTLRDPGGTSVSVLIWHINAEKLISPGFPLLEKAEPGVGFKAMCLWFCCPGLGKGSRRCHFLSWTHDRHGYMEEASGSFSTQCFRQLPPINRHEHAAKPIFHSHTILVITLLFSSAWKLFH